MPEPTSEPLVQPGDRWFLKHPHHGIEWLHVVGVEWKKGDYEKDFRWHYQLKGGGSCHEVRVRLFLDGGEPCAVGEHADDFTCRECGDVFNTGYPLGGDRLRKAGLCLNCDFWHSVIRSVEAGGSFVIDGHAYTVGREPSAYDLKHHRSHLGFGGERWHVRWPKGREVVSHNVSHRGEVPERFRGRLPDNAEHVHKTLTITTTEQS